MGVASESRARCGGDVSNARDASRSPRRRRARRRDRPRARRRRFEKSARGTAAGGAPVQHDVGLGPVDGVVHPTAGLLHAETAPLRLSEREEGKPEARVSSAVRFARRARVERGVARNSRASAGATGRERLRCGFDTELRYRRRSGEAAASSRIAVQKRTSESRRPLGRSLAMSGGSTTCLSMAVEGEAR